MYSKNILGTVGPIAQSQTAANRLLVVAGAHMPLAAACECYNDFSEGNKVGYSYELAKVSQEDFASDNQVISAGQEQQFEGVVDNMQTALQSVISTVRGRIIPAVNTLAAKFQEVQGHVSTPRLNVKVLEWDGVHSEPGLINHVQARYANVAFKPEYRTFMLGDLTVEGIIEKVALNNPHLEQAQVTEWLLKVGADRIASVWKALFNSTNLITPQNPVFSARRPAATKADEILLAYLLCGALVENPMDPVDGGASLDEWNLSLQLLHQFLGNQLLNVYNQRVSEAKAGLVILAKNAKEPLDTLTVEITINGDTYEKALAEGLTAEGVLGAAVYSEATHQADLVAHNEQMALRWNNLYPLIRQVAVDRSIKNQRKTVVAVLNQAQTLGLELPEADRAQLDNALNALSEGDYANPWEMFGKLVTKVFFDNPIYPEFIQAFARYSRIYPEATPRELAVFGLIEITALYQVQQIKVVDYTPVVDPNATLPTVSVEEENGELPTGEDDQDAPLPQGGEAPLTEEPVQAEEPGNALDNAEAAEEASSEEEIDEDKTTTQGQIDQAVLDRRDGIETPEAGATGDAQEVDEDGNPINRD